jgi:hypothetical protein
VSRIGTIAGVLVSAAVLAATASGAAQPVPGVTIIGDSVMTGVLWHPEAVAVMQAGLAVHWEVAVCRTLAGESCPFEGARPPTLLDVVHADGSSLGRTVVVEVGYNDPPATFATEVDESIRALLAAGVQHILWLDFREAQGQYADMNGVLTTAKLRYPQLTIVDWDGYAQRNYGWFQSDGIHLTAAGGLAMATLVHTAVMTATAPPLVVLARPLPSGRVGRPYAARVRVSGGRPPYRWHAVSGPLPRGLHLRPDGHIDGVPRRACRLAVEVSATDADGVTVVGRVQFDVRPTA